MSAKKSEAKAAKELTPGTGDEDKFPVDTETLAENLEDFGVKAAKRVAQYLAQGDLEDARWLDQGLSDMSVDLNIKKPFMKYWLNKKGKAIPEDIDRKLTPLQQKKDEEAKEKQEAAKAKYSVDMATGMIKPATTTDANPMTWDEAEKLSQNVKRELKQGEGVKKVTYTYDAETSAVRMAKEGEQGGTLEQAKELKRMAEGDKKAGAGDKFFLDSEGRWQLNPGATVSVLERMALEAMHKSEQTGGAIGPMEAITQASETLKILRDAMGGGGGVPDWMTDPVKFKQAMDTFNPRSPGDSELTKRFDVLNQKLEDMKEAQHRAQIEGQQTQITNLTALVQGLEGKIVEVGKGITGRTELDIIHDIAKEGISVAKTELPGLRSDLKEALRGGLPTSLKSPEQRETRKQEIQQALDKDKKLEELGKKLFFGEGQETGQK